VLSHLQNRVDGFLFGGIDEAAGVDHQNVGLFGIVRELVTPFHQMAHHDLGIDKVFRAAETYKAYFQGGESVENY
jgi:hypothetical protein